MLIDEASMAEGQIGRSFYRSLTHLYFVGSPFFKDHLKQKYRDSGFWKNISLTECNTGTTQKSSCGR
jgi:hypothetical protein